MSEMTDDSIQKLIKFRQSVDCLNEEEYIQCIKAFANQRIASFRKANLLKFIFDEFAAQLSQDKHENIDIMTDIINKIKASRRKDTELSLINTKNIIKCKKLNKLPSELIRVICCYLKKHERIDFERTNRSIFIDLRSAPIAIYAFDTRQHYFLNNLNVLKYVENMRIPFDDNEELQQVIDILSECKDLSRIKTLRIHSWADWGFLSMMDLMTVINKMINIEHFEYIGYFRNEHAELANYEWMKQLKAISIKNQCYHKDYKDRTHIMKNVCHSIECGDKLKSFHKGYELLTNEINGKLIGLKELCLPWKVHESDLKILIQQNLNNLERIQFILHNHNREEVSTNIHRLELMQLFMNKIIQSVNYIGIEMERTDESSKCNVLDILNNALKNTYINGKKQYLKIRMNDMLIRKNMNLMIEKYDKLLKQIAMTANHWMVICQDFYALKPKTESIKGFNALKKMLTEQKEMEGFRCSMTMNSKLVSWNDINFEMIEDKEILDGFLNSLKDKYDVAMIERVDVGAWHKYRFVISNKGCSINGYRESWILRCDECHQKCITNKYRRYRSQSTVDYR